MMFRIFVAGVCSVSVAVFWTVLLRIIGVPTPLLWPVALLSVVVTFLAVSITGAAGAGGADVAGVADQKRFTEGGDA